MTLAKQSWDFTGEGRLPGGWVCLHCRACEEWTAGQTWLTFNSQALHPTFSLRLLSCGVSRHFKLFQAIQRLADPPPCSARIQQSNPRYLFRFMYIFKSTSRWTGVLFRQVHHLQHASAFGQYWLQRVAARKAQELDGVDRSTRWKWIQKIMPSWSGHMLSFFLSQVL